MRHRLAFAFLILTFGAGLVMVASAQEAAPPRALVDTPAVEEAAPPISPKTSPGPMSLDACIELGFQHQPALDAARASLGAASSGERAINRLLIARLSPEMKYRRQQACQGVTIAGAALTQAEMATRYAVTRNFFTVQYIRAQQRVIDDVLQSLENGHKKVKKIYGAGDPNTKISKLDIDAIEVQIELVKGKKAMAKNGMLKALAALREAMGLAYDYPLEIAAVDLPAAVYEVKKTVVEVVEVTVEMKDKDGKVVKDKDGNAKTVTEKQKVKKVVSEYFPLYKFDKAELVAAALANRPEMTQASAASNVTDLEIAAQNAARGFKKDTFARAADIHVQQVPQGRDNGDYVPGAFAPEYPTMLAGRKADRVARAQDLHQRALALVDKANNLVSLDVEIQYLKWQEAVEDIQGLRKIYATAQKLPDQVLQLVQGKDLTSTQIIQANLTAIAVRTQLNDEMHIHALALAGLERATAGTFKVYPVPAQPK